MEPVARWLDRLRSLPLSVLNQGADLDDARTLCFECGAERGFPKKQVEEIIRLTGNPISAFPCECL